MSLYVAYSFVTATSAGVGRTILDEPVRITTFEQIAAIEKKIREDHPDFINVVLTFWQTLEG